MERTINRYKIFVYTKKTNIILMVSRNRRQISRLNMIYIVNYNSRLNIINFCSPIARYLELRDYLWSMYASAAQYNHPPGYPVTRICDAIDGAFSVNGTLSKVAAGVFAYRGNLSCYINEPRNETETDVGWRWQVIFLVETSVNKKLTQLELLILPICF